jgi:hypothetical protein
VSYKENAGVIQGNCWCHTRKLLVSYKETAGVIQGNMLMTTVGLESIEPRNERQTT